MPAPYKQELEKAARSVEVERTGRMRDFVAQLAGPTGLKRAQEAFCAYSESLNRFAQSRGVKQRSFPDCRKAFDEFLKRRAALARDPARIARHCRTLVFTPMPDLSNDEGAARDFRESFFADVAARVGDRRQVRVIRSIMEGVRRRPSDPSDPNQWATALKERLSRKRWTDDDWVGQKENV